MMIIIRQLYIQIIYKTVFLVYQNGIPNNLTNILRKCHLDEFRILDFMNIITMYIPVNHISKLIPEIR